MSVTHKLAMLGWLTAGLNADSAAALRQIVTELWSVDANLPTEDFLELVEFLETYLTDTVPKSANSERR